MVSEQVEEGLTKKYEYDGSGFLLYQGWARPGVGVTAARWRIAKYTTNGSGQITDTQWPSASKDFAFTWNDRATYTYT